MGLIVNFTPTGMVPTRRMTPHVPLSVSEIVEDVHAAWEVGITMVHLHARDPRTQEPTSDPAEYGRLIEGIRAFAGDLILCVSLSGRTEAEFSRRLAPLTLTGDLKPDMGSLTLSSLNFPQQASLNAPDTVQRLAAEMRDRGVLPELEVFDAGMLNYAKHLLKLGLLEPPHYVNLILGNIASSQVDFLHAGLMTRDLPGDSCWSFGGIGRAQLAANSLAIAAGGGVRVGLEDNIWYDAARTKLASNLDLLRRVHRLAAEAERHVMSPAACRVRLGLEPGHGRYGRRKTKGQ